MKILPTPNCVNQFYQMSGDVEFSFFEDIEDGIHARNEAIVSHLDLCIAKRPWKPAPGIDLEYFSKHSGAQITREEFIGSAFDEVNLEFVPVSSISGRNGQGLGFAYYFANPIYGPVDIETQNTRPDPTFFRNNFLEIRDILCPPGLDIEIIDWTSPNLLHLSDYFGGGLEWGEAMLYSLHIPKKRFIAVISQSTWP